MGAQVLLGRRAYIAMSTTCHSLASDMQDQKKAVISFPMMTQFILT